MTPAIPEIEIAHHAHALSVRRPHSKASALHAVLGQNMRAQLLVDMVVITFTKQMKIEIGEVGYRL